jgi:hypothetical protein
MVITFVKETPIFFQNCKSKHGNAKEILKNMKVKEDILI